MIGQKQRRLMGAMRVILLRIKFLTIFLFFGLTAISWAGAYLLSAHGNSVYGVKRTTRLDLGRGNCGHCHDQHGQIDAVSNGGPYRFALFSNNFNSTATSPYWDDDSICFLCHGGTYQSGGIINYDYSQTYGGYSGGPSSILEAFNQISTYPTSASWHNLSDIYNFAAGNFSFFTPYSNPCVACHNPHRAKKVQADPQSPSNNTAISLPTAHETLWGDESNETMYYLATIKYGLKYQAPYYSGVTTYEPGGTTLIDGSTLPDYVTFCTTCHNTSYNIYSNELGAFLRQIYWDGTGGDSAVPVNGYYPDKHGENTATVSTLLNAPYNSTLYSVGDLITSCTDCHEPHGSPNPYLIRREVNGVSVTVSGTTGNEIGYLCRACHQDDAALNAGTLLVNGWYYAHHSDPSDAPYPGPPSGCSWCHGGGGTPPIACLNCHKHGLDDSWVSTTGKTPSGRICF